MEAVSQTILTPVFTTLLKRFVKTDAEQMQSLSVSLTGGSSVVLRNLELNLTELVKRFPISIDRAFVQELSVRIPWTSLGSEPVEVYTSRREDSTRNCMLQRKCRAHSYRRSCFVCGQVTLNTVEVLLREKDAEEEEQLDEEVGAVGEEAESDDEVSNASDEEEGMCLPIHWLGLRVRVGSVPCDSVCVPICRGS
eukprot:scaffold990_cov393-Prasinococcus_capsulatus_cf.AAC.52